MRNDDTLTPDEACDLLIDAKTREEVESIIRNAGGINWPLYERPVVVTGGDTAHGEVVRGDVLLVHYDEATENPDYARDMLAEAERAHAPSNVIDSLVEIITDTLGEPVDPKHMTREARLEELRGLTDDELSEDERAELARLENEN